MLISLVLCTVGRDAEVKLFIDSIIQSECNVELIIVDQNRDNRIDRVIDECCFPENFIIKHIKPDVLGLSRARNIGLEYVTGDIFAFPDDDCIYSKGVLNYVGTQFYNSQFDFFSCKTHERNKPEKSLIQCEATSFEITMSKRAGCSFTLFFKNSQKMLSVRFDECMGVGSGTIYGAGEETDYLTQVMHLKLRGYYEPCVVVLHDAKEDSYDEYTLTRLVSYGGGYAYHLRKNYKKLGFIYSCKLLLAIPLRIIKSINNREEFVKSIYFTKGTINGLFR